MPELITEQERLFGTREEEYGNIAVENRELYPFIRLIQAVADEVKLDHDGETLYVRAIDPANVSMVEIELRANTGLPEFTAGVNIERLSGIIQNKPRGSDSVLVNLNFAFPVSTIEISQEMANGRIWNFYDRFPLIDPDSIRKRESVPDLEMEAHADVHVDGMVTFLKSLDSTEPIRLVSDDDGFFIGQTADAAEYQSLVNIHGDDVVDGQADSLYSRDYLEGMFKGLKAAEFESVQIEWTDEFPLFIHFGNESITGKYVLAPRVSKE